MLSENIRTARRSKGLSQEELAVKVHVVRQTISKWEKGLSVPDADMLILLSEALDMPVSSLLGPAAPETRADDLRAIAEKLEVVNLQLAKREALRRKALCGLLVAPCVLVAAIFAVLFALDSPYLAWDYSDPETAVAGVALHALEWLFVRLAPIVLLASALGLVLVRR